MAAWRMVEDGGTLRIEHPSRASVTVGVEGWRFVVRRGSREVGRFAIFDVGATARTASGALRDAGRDAPYTVALSAHAVPHPMMVAGRLMATRTRLLAAVHPRVWAVRERLAPLTPALPHLACAEALYADPWIVSDVLRYHAAAVALAFVETALKPADVPWEPTSAAGEAALLGAMRTWGGLFSPTGRPYRSLNRTLMRLAPSVPPELLCRLRHVELARPYVDARDLTILLVAHAVYERAPRPEIARSHLEAFVRAGCDEAVAAIERLGAAVGRRLSADRIPDVRQAIALVADYPRPYGGRLAGLVERALRWHRVPIDVRSDVAAVGGVTIPTRRPPVPLPTDPRITFLGTVGDVLDEGDRMHHCVGAYARRAVAGGCFLFHVEYRGEAATIEVASDGGVVQACGASNRRNVATAWGRRQLRAWGMNLVTKKRNKYRWIRRIDHVHPGAGVAPAEQPEEH